MGLDVALFVLVLAAVFLTVATMGLLARTLSLTLVFRVAIPPATAATVLVALAGGIQPTGQVACLLGIVLAVFSVTLVDQMVWLLTAGFMRANE